MHEVGMFAQPRLDRRSPECFPVRDRTGGQGNERSITIIPHIARPISTVSEVTVIITSTDSLLVSNSA